MKDKTKARTLVGLVALRSVLVECSEFSLQRFTLRSDLLLDGSLDLVGLGLDEVGGLLLGDLQLELLVLEHFILLCEFSGSHYMACKTCELDKKRKAVLGPDSFTQPGSGSCTDSS